jgi:hypothetical protein
MQIYELLKKDHDKAKDLLASITLDFLFSSIIYFCFNFCYSFYKIRFCMAVNIICSIKFR